MAETGRPMALAASACVTTEQESKLPRDLTGPGDVADAFVVGDATDELVVAGVLDDLDEDEPHPASTIAAETPMRARQQSYVVPSQTP